MLDAQNDSIETFLNQTGIDDDNIQNNGITGSDKLVNASVTTAKIANGAITSTKIAAGGILNANIADATIQAGKLVANSLSDSQITAKGITNASIADNTLTSGQLAAGIGLSPSGAILAYGGTAAPTGYLMCDGSSYLRTDYADLFTAIGTAFGAADGSHFNVPDLRGRFLRGTDGGASRDPDKASRTAMATGGNTGDNVGSVQTGQVQSHSHTLNVFTTTGASSPNLVATDTASNGPASGAHPATNTSGGNETRPINAGVNFIIKT